MNALKNFQTSTVAILLFFSLNLVAQDSTEVEKENRFIISAQFRPRAEFRHGAFQPLPKGAKSAALVSQRTRLLFNYQFKDILGVQITPQFVSVWGQESLAQGVANSNAFNLFEVWANLKLTSTTTMKVGRQVISLDDERFFGELDWAQGGRSHDALSVEYKKNKFNLRGFAAFNQNYKALYNNNLNNVSGTLFSTKDAAPYKWMQTLWAKYAVNENDNLSILFTNLGFQNADKSTDTGKTYFLQVVGANYFHTGANWAFNLSGYYQGGKDQQGKATSAYMLAIGLNRKISTKWSLGLYSDFVSGNKIGTSSNKKNQAFTPYFITGHKFFGTIDYFYAGNSHKGVGLWDGYLKVNFKPNEKLNFTLTAHQFVAPFKIYNLSSKMSPNLGQEIDWDFGYTINKFVKLIGGYSLYCTTPTLNFLKNVNDTRVAQHWVWTSLIINPKFLDFKH